MKTITTILMTASVLFLNAQCNVGISTGSHSVCIPGTYQVGSAFSSSVVISGEGAVTYSWTDGTSTLTTSSISYAPIEAGTTTYTLTGTCVNNSTGMSVITLTAVVCELATGIPTYSADPIQLSAPIYFDITGRQVEKRTGELLIEQRGNYRRKVVFQE